MDTPKKVSFILAGTELINTSSRNSRVSLLLKKCLRLFRVTGFPETGASGIFQLTRKPSIQLPANSRPKPRAPK
ncbi:hypothetical protein D3C81_1789390 [compost metagenome]